MLRSTTCFHFIRPSSLLVSLVADPNTMITFVLALMMAGSAAATRRLLYVESGLTAMNETLKAAASRIPAFAIGSQNNEGHVTVPGPVSVASATLAVNRFASNLSDPQCLANIRATLFEDTAVLMRLHCALCPCSTPICSSSSTWRQLQRTAASGLARRLGQSSSTSQTA